MSEDWKTQLQSEDPRVRVEAIKAIANSGNRANLPYLKEVVDTDPDPRVQDYARKAARHLFTSTEGPVPQETAAREEEKPAREPKPPSPEPAADPPEANIPPGERTAAETKIQRALSLHMRGSTQKGLKAFAQGLDLDPNLANETFTRSVAAELTGLDPDQALEILMDPEERKELLTPQKKKTPELAQKTETAEPPQPDKPKKSRSGIIQTWLSFFRMTKDFLKEVADHANTEDTFLSVLVFTIAAVVIFMITGFVQFQQFITLFNQQLALMGEEIPTLDFNIGIIFFSMLIVTLVMTPVTFFISAGLQFLGVKLFGGSGEFRTHLYLLALIQVPITILGGILSFLSFIPGIVLVAGLIGFGLAIYGLIINVRAIMAVHDLPVGRAVAGMIIPPIVVGALISCLLMIFGSALVGILAGMLPT